MVKGLYTFRGHFQEYADRYVLIGGTACDIAMTEAGLTFRATKDRDIVLCIEALDAEFVQAFWAYISSGKYQSQEKSTGEKQFYRFYKPQDENYPFMLELFARKPDVLQIAEGAHLTPLPMEESLSSLSAILMENDYYNFILSGRREVDGVAVVGASHLIPLKAKAWLDLSARAGKGEQIDSKTIKKHKNDVFRLYQILDPEVDPEAPGSVRADIAAFLAQMRGEDVDLPAMGIRTKSRDAILDELARTYRLA